MFELEKLNDNDTMVISDDILQTLGLSQKTENFPIRNCQSMENLALNTTLNAEISRKRLCQENGIGEHDFMPRSPVMIQHEHGLGASGLWRIRQQPLNCVSNVHKTGETSRSTSANLQLPKNRAGPIRMRSGPSSPTLHYRKVLTRFPSESNTYSRAFQVSSPKADLALSLFPGAHATLKQQIPGQKQIMNTIFTEPDKEIDRDPISVKIVDNTKEIENDSSENSSICDPIFSITGSEESFSHEVVIPVPKKTINDFVIIDEIGQGAYGQVKLARYKRDSNQKMVIKYVTKRRILIDTWTRDRRLGTVPLEIHVLDFLRRNGLKHPNIIEMTDFFEDDVNYYIEMVPHGLPGMDLFDYIELRTNMGEDECRNIFVQVARAIFHLHTKASIVHRDIKDENIILDREGKIKLVDFGSAAYIKNGPFDVFVGTMDYAAPEVLTGKPYRGKEQDVWALGILLYTIVYKENPFYCIEEIMDQDLRIPHVMNEANLDLIRAMLDRDVDSRITIEEVLEHPWCKMIDNI